MFRKAKLLLVAAGRVVATTQLKRKARSRVIFRVGPVALLPPRGQRVSRVGPRVVCTFTGARDPARRQSHLGRRPSRRHSSTVRASPSRVCVCSSSAPSPVDGPDPVDAPAVSVLRSLTALPCPDNRRREPCICKPRQRAGLSTCWTKCRRTFSSPSPRARTRRDSRPRSSGPSSGATVSLAPVYNPTKPSPYARHREAFPTFRGTDAICNVLFANIMHAQIMKTFFNF